MRVEIMKALAKRLLLSLPRSLFCCLLRRLRCPLRRLPGCLFLVFNDLGTHVCGALSLVLKPETSGIAVQVSV